MKALRIVVVLVFVVSLAPASLLAAAGDLDCTFGTGGTVSEDVGSIVAAYDAGLQSSGKIVTVSSSSVAEALRLTRFNANGTLDTSFGSSGTITHSYTGLEYAGVMAIDSSDKIVVAGRIVVSGIEEVFVARYKADGSVDTTFNTTGWTHFKFDSSATSSSLEGGYDVVVDSSDRPIVGGYFDANGNTFNPSNSDMAIARLTTGGALDTGFGSGSSGIAFASSPGTSNDDGLRALTIDGSGNILGIGFTQYPDVGNSGPRQAMIARWTSAGVLDTNFNSSGAVPGVKLLDMTGAGTDNFGIDIAVDGNGKIIAMGQGTDDPLLARLTSSGALDTTFSGDGLVDQSFVGGQDIAAHVLIQSDNKILLTGWPIIDSYDHFAVMRFTTAGALDSTWGGSGVVTTKIIGPVGNESDRAAILQPDERLILAGGVDDGGNLELARYLNDNSTISGTTTTITSDGTDPSLVGDSITVDVSVKANSGSAAPTGTVDIGDGVDSCTATLAAGSGTTSTGSCNVALSTSGARTLTASYVGTDTFCKSSDTEAHQVLAGTTTTTITSQSSTTTVVGESFTAHYTVAPSVSGTPTGNVTVSDGVDSCVGTVAAGQCSLALTTVGNRTLTATYAGDSTFSGSTSAGVSHVVDKAGTTTTITSDSPNPVDFEHPVTVYFDVSVEAPGAGVPDGLVTVDTGGAGGCSATVSEGSCTFSPSAPGQFTLTAQYEGDASFAASSGTAPSNLDVLALVPTLSTRMISLLALALALAGLAFIRRP